MSEALPPDLTTLLNRMFRGDEEAGNQAMDSLYTSLRRIAHARLRKERPGHLLETKALVNEAMLRLFGSRSVAVRNRQHFLALACLLMKRILIESGRRHSPIFESLDESMAAMDEPSRELAVSVDRILDTFSQLDPAAYKVLQLKVATGMTIEEIAEELACSTGTVKRRFSEARVWMFKELQPLLDR